MFAHFIASRAGRLRMSLAFSVLEALIALTIGSSLLLALAVSHSRTFSLLAHSDRKIRELRQQSWKTSDISARSCRRSISPHDNSFLDCRISRAPEPYASRTFAIESN